MSKKGTHTTSDYLEFDNALNKATNLLNGKDKNFGLYIIVSINVGLRVGDVLKLTWEQLRQDTILLTEQKTGKRREILLNHHIRKAVNKIDNGYSGNVFKSQKGTVYSIMTVNRKLKALFGTKTKKLNISSHSCRKAFGRAIFFASGESEKALIYLSDLFNHNSSKVTRVYLGIRQEELNNLYSML